MDLSRRDARVEAFRSQGRREIEEHFAGTWPAGLKNCCHAAGLLEAACDLRAHFETAAANPGPDRDIEVARIAPEAFLHPGDRFCQDARQDAPPACVDRPHCLTRRIGNEDGEAIGNLNRERYSRLIARQSVPFEGPGREAADHLYDVGVKLAEGDQGHSSQSERSCEPVSVQLHSVGLLARRIAEVESAGDRSVSRREAVADNPEALKGLAAVIWEA